MAKASRSKGVRGEAEVRALYAQAGLTVRGLEDSGDHLVLGGRRLVHSECKRQEVARPWLWWEQAESETEASAMTVVPFRRNRSPWLAIVRLDDLAELLR